MKISIIIPVYGVECYLNACVDSVLCQDYPDFEVILVDDGSPDRCGTICDEYARRDHRVKVIHKENGGASDARNCGIAQARGEYILFTDGDDFWADTRVLSRLASRVSQTTPDILNYSYQKYWEGNGKLTPYGSDVAAMPVGVSRAEQYEYLTGKGLYIASACNKMIRRELLLKVPFRKGNLCEDIEWCAKLACHAECMDYIPEKFYIYRQREGSTRYTIRDQNCVDLAATINLCMELIRSADTDSAKLLRHYTAFQFGTFFIAQAQAEHIQTAPIQSLEKNAHILAYHGRNIKLMLLNIGQKLLGYRNLCMLIRKLYRARL